MQKTLGWMLYVALYTGFFGIPLLFVPNALLPSLGFDTTTGPWARLSGMFLIVLSYLAFMIYHKKITALLFHTIIVRAFISIVLIVLGLAGYPRFLYVIAGIVLIGVVGSTVSFVHEKTGLRP